MKITLAILFAMVAAISAQNRNVDPRMASILAEARYLSGDGSFGAAYVQEDGTDFKEETDADGTRKGSYSYYDPSGKKTTINYTAGKNGFQVTGDHLPKAPAPLPVPRAAAPVPQYQPQPQYQQQYQPQQYNQQQSQNQYQQYNNFGQQSYVQTTTTTPAPSRFFPPGKLNLNRTPDGYQYSFQSN